MKMLWVEEHRVLQVGSCSHLRRPTDCERSECEVVHVAARECRCIVNMPSLTDVEQIEQIIRYRYDNKELAVGLLMPVLSPRS